MYYILYYERFLKTVRQTIEQFASITVKRFLFYLYIIIYSVYNSQSETVVCINISLNRFGFLSLFFMYFFFFFNIFFNDFSKASLNLFMVFICIYFAQNIYTKISGKSYSILSEKLLGDEKNVKLLILCVLFQLCFDSGGGNFVF